MKEREEGIERAESGETGAEERAKERAAGREAGALKRCGVDVEQPPAVQRERERLREAQRTRARKEKNEWGSAGRVRSSEAMRARIAVGRGRKREEETSEDRARACERIPLESLVCTALRPRALDRAPLFAAPSLSPFCGSLPEPVLRLPPCARFVGSIALYRAEFARLLTPPLPSPSSSPLVVLLGFGRLQRQYPCNDFNTTDFLGRVLDAEQPDLVIFTGDNLSGSMPDPELSIRRWSQPAVDRQIPWVCSTLEKRSFSWDPVVGTHNPHAQCAPRRRPLFSATTMKTRVRVPLPSSPSPPVPLLQPS